MAANELNTKSWVVRELDGKFNSILKSLLKGPLAGSKVEKVTKQFRDLRSRIVDDGLGRTLDGLFEDFSRPPGQRRKLEVDEALTRIQNLRDKAFVETAGLLFITWREALRDLNLERVLPYAPTAACLEDWIKVAKASVKEVEKHLLADPAVTYATAGGDWILERAKPRDLLPLLELFLSRQPRPACLRPWSEALVTALKRDKRGRLLDAVLRHSWPDADRISALAEAVRSNRSLLRMVVDLLPSALAQKGPSPNVTACIAEIFGTITTSKGEEREFISAALARLECGILMADRRGQEAEEVIALAQKAGRQLRSFTRDEELQARTWILEKLHHEGELVEKQLHVTSEGARVVALGFEKIAQGFAARDILAVTALNLGLVSFANLGEVVAYNPLQHEDVDGGMVPGETGVIHEVGWSYRSEIIARAKVKRGQRGSPV